MAQGGAGHAGLFSNANDLAKLMQMLMQDGTYGGERYLDSATVSEFTRCQFCDQDNRRGAGFDKPVKDGNGPTNRGISQRSFGHTGFTGTIAWADPDQEVVFIFLSNRVHPSSTNRKLIKENIRPRMMEVVYNAIKHTEAQAANE